jgi:exonuclease SbcD
VSVVVTDQEYPEDLGTKLRSRFPYLLELQHRPPIAGGVDVGSTPAERDPIDVMTDFVFHVTGAQATQAQRDLLTEVFEQAMASERGE